MALLPSNILQNVQTFQMAELAFMQNSFAAIMLSNKKFKDFNKLTANLGDTVTFDLAPRFVSRPGLVITNQPSVQRPQPLVCSQATNTSSAYSDQQFIFNVEDYMSRFGMAAVKQIGTDIESDILKSIDSTLTVNDPENGSFGSLIPNTGPFRFYGNSTTQINSFGQLAQALANFRAYGADNSMTRCILPMQYVPSIVNTGLSQFAMTRNNEIANSWELGKFSDCEFYESNLLPLHISGTIGDATGGNNVVTVVTSNDPTGNNITNITFTEPTSSTSATAFQAGDLIQFNDPTFRFLTFIGQKPTSLPVQLVVTGVAASSAGTVSVNVRTATNIGLVSAPIQNQNINKALIAGMTATVMPSHQTGIIWSGDQWYLAMPQLPDYEPYPSVQQTDPESGASMRHYWGNLFGKNVRSYVRDTIWGSTLVPENSMRLLFPINMY
jgi:hypothetical protein